MRKKKGDEVIFDEHDRERYLLEFHHRKQQKKIDYLAKKALRDKKKHVLERIARKRNLIRREKELGLLDSEYDHPKVTSKKDMEDKFTKDMFGTDEVTVTVEYDGDDAPVNNEELSDAALLNDENEVEETGEAGEAGEAGEMGDVEELDENDLDEEEKQILENVKLSDKEMRKIKEQAAAKKKKKKRKSRRKHGK